MAGIVLVAVLVLFTASAQAVFRRDTAVHVPPSYYTMTPPAVGEVYKDPTFGTLVKRVTDAPSMSLEHLTQHYPTSSPFSLDSDWLLVLANNGYRHLLTGDGSYVRRCPVGFQEARWSRRHPDIAYYPQGNSLRGYNAATDSQFTVRTFSQYSNIVLGKGKSDLSDNDRTTIIGDDRYILIYDIATDTEYAALDAGGRFFNWARPTPDGDGFAVQWDQGTSRWQGLELFDINGQFQRQLLNAGGHGDMGRDVDGTQVYFQSNAATMPKQPAGSGKAMVKVRLSDGQVTLLHPLHYSLAMHMSARAGDGWVYLSTYAYDDPDPAVTWYAYSNEILRIRADGSLVERIVHHRSRANRYWRTSRAAISMDGTKLVYASDYRVAGQLPDYVDTYMIDLSAADGRGFMIF